MPANDAHRSHTEGVFIHVYNKGVADKAIFADQQDFDTFLNYLSQYLSPIEDQNTPIKSFTVRGRTYKGIPHLPKNYFKKVELVAYSLHTNHFHLLLQQKNPRTVEKFIRSLCTRYAIYFNKKHKVTGAIFQGPYKSTAIDNIDEVLHLTRYFHQDEAGNAPKAHVSSYEVFLGVKQAPWVKSDTIISHFENTDNDFFKGITGYRNFVEKYQPTLNDSKLLEKIVLEDKTDHLVRSTVSEKNTEKNGQSYNNNSTSLPHYKRFPEIGAALAIFLLLFGLGLNNIKTTAAKSVVVHQFPNGKVSGASDEKPENPSEPAPIENKIDFKDFNIENVIKTLIQYQKAATGSAVTENQNSVQNSSDPTLPKEEVDETSGSSTDKTLRIKITDGSQSVNLRRSASLQSEKVAEANEGEDYKYISFESGWYKVLLEDGTTCYVSSKYIELIN